MKTKRTIFSIVVFLSVFWISTLLGFDIPADKEDDKQENENTLINTDNSDSNAAYDARLNSLTNKYGASVASVSERLYLYEELDTDIQTDQDTDLTENEESEDIDINDMTGISQEDTIQDIEPEVIEPETIGPETIEPEPTPSLYADIGISIANSYVNIRDKANTESEIKGKLYRDSAAKILDMVGDWYYVESGSLKGYVNTDYIKTGIPDDELIEKYGRLRVSISTEGLNVREKPDIESNKLTVVYKNEIYPVIDLHDEWLKVDISDDRVIGYVNREYVELLVDFEKAVSKEEEEELKKLQEEERIRQEKVKEEERIKKETEVKYREEVDYTQEELKLLACLVHAEAGNQSYEGKLAVANVVLNRVKSSKYANTIEAVIYQPGQFTVSRSGSLEKQLDRYESYSTKSQLLTIKAAKAALSGANNIGSRLYFNAYESAVSKGYDQKKTSVKIEDHLFW
ncbi:MAG: cell wall hydrolase [Clostridiales bacterium]|jgi:spore germination cell wall hydrolase CwlJ-like protein|nr:cell wall hydrolase [Clostridiales bacterium]